MKIGKKNERINELIHSVSHSLYLGNLWCRSMALVRKWLSEKKKKVHGKHVFKV